MKITLVLSLAVVCVLVVLVNGQKERSNSPKSDDFKSYKKHHSKRYKNKQHEEESEKHFMRNRDMIREHNARAQKGEVKYKMELNEFTDLDDETLNGMDGLVIPDEWLNEQKKLNRRRRNYLLGLADMEEPPKTFDWRNVNGRSYVTPAKQQGHCGDCYAFSAIGTMESQVLINGWAQQSLSAEQPTDCIHEDTKTRLKAKYTDNGCHGGLPLDVFQYVKDIGGITTEDVYPFTLQRSKVSAPCTYNPKTGVQRVADLGSTHNPSNADLKKLLYNKGPLSVGINAGGLKHYKEGVFENEEQKLTHAVLLVGYGSNDSDGNYWIIKNSWGTNWGEDDGFFKLSMDRKKNAGLTGDHSAIFWVELADD